MDKGIFRRLPALALAAALACLPLSGCAGGPEGVQRTVLAMDTVMTLTVYGSGREAGEEDALSLMNEWIVALEGELSATKPDSAVYALNTGGAYEAGADDRLIPLLEQSLALCAATGGALDITAYPAVKAWGFASGEYRVPGGAELEGLAERIDYSALSVEGGTVSLPEGMELDLGAVAKGYAGDVLSQGLREMGFQSALLDLGQSSIQAVGGRPDGSPWRIGVQDPGKEGYLGVVELEDSAMGTSGGYQRYFTVGDELYWHIIDPDTAAPARSGLASVTVVGPSGLVCDGLSTALFVMGLEEGAAFWRANRDFEAIFIREDGSIAVTAGLEGRFSLARGYEGREVTVLE